jgi:hypothetical protein
MIKFEWIYIKFDGGRFHDLIIIGPLIKHKNIYKLVKNYEN